jgi:hypothetical protein
MSNHSEGANSIFAFLKVVGIFIINLTISEIHELLGIVSFVISIVYIAFKLYVDFHKWKFFKNKTLTEKEEDYDGQD